MSVETGIDEGVDSRPDLMEFSAVLDVQYVYGPEALRLRQAQSDAIREVLECMATSRNRQSKKRETPENPGQ
ncbi:hypothetical protein [Glycomyces sp. MUSA5-2]|uniref:hypothetical protein n=1 Tax=Glycomyces sp. MUSA5-2 TaxID=2053002 RepID=UPI00300A5F5D